MLKETIFVNGRPVGVILTDTNASRLSFHPSASPSLLPDRDWNSPDEMRQALIKAYTKVDTEKSPQKPF